MQDRIEAEVAEMAGCLRMLAWKMLNDGLGRGRRRYSGGVKEFGDVEEGENVEEELRGER